MSVAQEHIDAWRAQEGAFRFHGFETFRLTWHFCEDPEGPQYGRPTFAAAVDRSLSRINEYINAHIYRMAHPDDDLTPNDCVNLGKLPDDLQPTARTVAKVEGVQPSTVARRPTGELRKTKELAEEIATVKVEAETPADEPPPPPTPAQVAAAVPEAQAVVKRDATYDALVKDHDAAVATIRRMRTTARSPLASDHDRDACRSLYDQLHDEISRCSATL